MVQSYLPDGANVTPSSTPHFCEITVVTNRPTDRPHYSVCSNRPHLASAAMRPNNIRQLSCCLLDRKPRITGTGSCDSVQVTVTIEKVSKLTTSTTFQAQTSNSTAALSHGILAALPDNGSVPYKNQVYLFNCFHTTYHYVTPHHTTTV